MYLAICCFGVLVMNMCFATSAFAQTPTPSALTIDQTSVPIRVDGHLEDWPSARMFRFDQKNQIIQGKSLWQGEDDFSGRVFLTYDDQYLYLSAVVKKTNKKVVNDNGNLSLTNGDCLELFIATDPSQHQPLLTREDYHLVFSPGTDCKDPKAFCLNKNTQIPGVRLIARAATSGYILEGCVPLVFLEGLQLGSGKAFGLALALDDGGELSGNRILRMVYGGNGVDLDDPGSWALAQWTGTVTLEVPFKRSYDLNAALVEDGTQGNTYLGKRDLNGLVLGPDQKPLAGAKIALWPKGAETLTEADGRFTLANSKIYTRTVVTARKKGFVSSVAALPAKGKAVTLSLFPVPDDLKPKKGVMGPSFMGAVLPALPPALFDAYLAKMRPMVEPLHLGILRLAAPEEPMGEEDHVRVIHSFETFARDLGAEPMVSLPLEGYSAALAYFKGTHGKPGIRYWAIGGEEDLKPDAGTDRNNSYAYLNRFRSIANALKTQEPGILLWGPETGGDSPHTESDWVTPLLKYDGDVVNGVSLHRYGWTQGVSVTAQALQDSLRHEIDTLVGLEDRVVENSDLDLPFAITGGITFKTPGDSPTTQAGAAMFQALWEADQRGIYLKGSLSMFLAGKKVWEDGPSYWALRLWSQMKRGRMLNVVSRESLVSAYATQDPKSKDVTLMLINKSDRYWRPKIRFNGEDDQVMVEGGLDQRYDFECPSFSISLLEVHADHSPGKAWVLDQDSAKNGASPRTVPLNPW